MGLDRAEASKIFVEIMRRCKLERRAKHRDKIASKEMAKHLGITVGYMSAFENARTLPSIELFLKYLIFNHFDLSPLLHLTIAEPESSLSHISRLREELLARMGTMDEEQLQFLIEQAKIAVVLKMQKEKPPSPNLLKCAETDTT